MKPSQILFSKVANLFGNDSSLSLTFNEIDREVYTLKINHDSGQTEFTVRCNEYGCIGRAEIHHVRIKDSDGSYITLWDGHNNKIELPSITVSLEKSAEKIVNDIKRKLLVEAIGIDKRAQEKKDAHNTFQRAKDKTITDIATLFSTVPIASRHDRPSDKKIDPYNGIKRFEGFGYGEILVHSENSITVHLESMGNQFATEICQALAEVFKRHQPAKTT